MDILHIIAGPLIGAVIGYCTNWIAVKMLFKPLEPIKVFGKTLPFTPGVIPKNRGRIAKACGKAVGETLLTESDLKKAFLDDNTKKSVAASIYAQISCQEFADLSINQASADILGVDKTVSVKEHAAGYLSDRISNVLSEFDYGEVIVKAGGSFIREKLNNPMISMFLNDSVIASFAEPAADSIRDYITGEGKMKIDEISYREVENLCDLKLADVVNINENEELIINIIGEVYAKVVEKLIPVILQGINISDMVEQKIAEMDVKFLEEMVLSIMKTELDYVVRLGALIGFVIGIVNIFC